MSTWVLLRGLTREAGHWGAFPQQLERRLRPRRIVCLDLPGNGTLHRQASPWRVEDMVSHCRERLRALREDGPCALVAMSLGAMVAVSWAAAHPRELAGCVLINTSLRPFNPFHQRLRPSSYPALLRVLAGHEPHAREAEILGLTSRLADPSVVGQWAALRRERPVSRLNALRQLVAAARFRAPPAPPAVPMLVLGSLGDRLVDPRCSETLAARWGLALCQHPAAGHDLPLDDGPWVAERIAGWWAELGTDDAISPGGLRAG
ncbi:alpha/beta fold hydrolase [Caldimonas tepidiphila]|uniref:alpha/beta fold hydrolase n=1 Tax=Caldimonas tepidiphila TaxID=2315841 RepID=UPI000E5BA14C|nr:alpha/beta hydrolase [Caldimonas tepidiphila]